MRKMQLFSVSVFLVLLGATLLAGCSSDSKSGTSCAAPTVDVNGMWSVTGANDSNTCGDPTGSLGTFTMYFTQSGSTVTDSSGMTGTICGNIITLKDSYPEDSGTTTETITVTVNAGNPMTFTGSGSWSWTTGTYTCTGKDSWSGTKQ